MRQWIRRAGKFSITREECPHPGVAVDLSRPRVGVGHTIEGSLDSGMAVFRQHFAPHFVVGHDRIIQCVPLGFEASSLEHAGAVPETNKWAVAQVEVEGFSDLDVWMPAAPVARRFEALMFKLQDECGIPIVRPHEFNRPLQQGITWASNDNPRRVAARKSLWGHRTGWWMHLEVPDQPSGHWDMGNVDWPQLLLGAKAGSRKPYSVFREGEHVRDFRTRAGVLHWQASRFQPRKGKQIQVRHRDGK